MKERSRKMKDRKRDWEGRKTKGGEGKYGILKRKKDGKERKMKQRLGAKGKIGGVEGTEIEGRW